MRSGYTASSGEVYNTVLSQRRRERRCAVMIPKGEGWVAALPLTEREEAEVDELIEDAAVGDVTVEVAREWRRQGVRIGHA